MKKLMLAGAFLAFSLSTQAQSAFSESAVAESSPAIAFAAEAPATSSDVLAASTAVTAESVTGSSVGFGLNSVPEPSTYALVASGAAGLFFMRRRKQ